MQSRCRYNLTANACIYVVIILLFSLTANGRKGKVNWNQFRGPNGQGVVEADSIAVNFGPESNVLWKIASGSGHSSPVIFNDRIFLTTHDSADKKELITLGIDRENGKILWRQIVQAETNIRLHPLNNPASCTPAADEKHVYVYFGTYGLLCYDHTGGKVWQRKIEAPKSKYGMATSPI